MSVKLPALEHDVERYYMDCFEYQFWYMVRELGLNSYLPVLNAKSFYSLDNMDDVFNYEMNSNVVQVSQFYLDNIKCLKSNLETYFNVKFKNFSRNEYPDFCTFVKDAISKNRVVFSIYDNYFNTTDNEKFYLQQHAYHGTVILGYDDEKKIYFTNRDDINCSDVENMVQHSMSKFKNIDLNLCIESWDECSLSKESLQQKLSDDLKVTIKDWEEEIKLLRVLDKEFLNLENDDETIIRKSLFLRSLFVGASTGLHGNFIYKLRLLEELYDKNLDEFFNKFLANRNVMGKISNVIGKASFLLKVDHDDGMQTLKRAKENFNKYLIDESSVLLEEFKELIKNEF